LQEIQTQYGNLLLLRATGLVIVETSENSPRRGEVQVRKGPWCARWLVWPVVAEFRWPYLFPVDVAVEEIQYWHNDFVQAKSDRDRLFESLSGLSTPGKALFGRDRS